MGEKIFISYKRVDKQRVFELKRQIEENTGHKCWIDIDGIESDAQFVSVIMRAIKECELFLFMYSKEHSKITDYEQDWTVREIMFARNKKKRIVFVNLDGTELADWFEFMFVDKQQVDSLDSEAVVRLCADIMRWFAIHPEGHGTVVDKNQFRTEISFNVSEESSLDTSDKKVVGQRRGLKTIIDKNLTRSKPLAYSVAGGDIFPYLNKGKFGYKDEVGNVVVECKYDAAYKFSEGLACVRLNGKWGFIDKLGREVIKCKYDTANDFSGGFARVGLNGELGEVDKHGNYVVNKRTDEVLKDVLGATPVPYMKNGKFGYKDEVGNVVVECKYDAAYKFSEGLACVRLNGKWGFIDKLGREVIKCKYDTANDFSGGFARVGLNGELGEVDKHGNYVVNKRTDEVLKDVLGATPVPYMKNGKFGYKDKVGNVVVECKYDAAYKFSEGLACVRLNGKWGFIDKLGREVIKCKYDTANDFSGGLARVVFNGKHGVVDKFGNCTLDK